MQTEGETGGVAGCSEILQQALERSTREILPQGLCTVCVSVYCVLCTVYCVCECVDVHIEPANRGKERGGRERERGGREGGVG